jgi:hypothetical protein
VKKPVALLLRAFSLVLQAFPDTFFVSAGNGFLGAVDK